MDKRIQKAVKFYFKTEDGIEPAKPFVNSIHYLGLSLIRIFTEYHLSEVLNSKIKFGRRGKMAMINDILERQTTPGEYTLDNCPWILAKLVISSFEVLKTDEHKPLSNREKRMVEFVIRKDFQMTIADVSDVKDLVGRE